MPPTDPTSADNLVTTELQTPEEIAAAEDAGVMRARRWALGRRRKVERILSEPFLRDLHRRMFGETWCWAGSYRSTHRGHGIAAGEINDAIRTAIADTRHDLREEYYTSRELAAHFHHRLARIHPFPHGNGRWSRLATDILLLALGEPVATWGGNTQEPAPRDAYIAALKAADAGDFDPLFRFMWS